MTEGSKKPAAQHGKKKKISTTTEKKSLKSVKNKNKKDGIGRKDEPVPIQDDPWKGLKSPYGGRMSKAEEFQYLRKYRNRLVEVGIVKQNQKITSKGKIVLGEVELEGICGSVLTEGSTSDTPGISLSLQGCGIEKVEFDDGAKFSSQLVRLDLASNLLSSSGCVRFSKSNCFLRELNLANNGLSIDLTSVLDCCPHLLILNLSENPLETCHVGTGLAKLEHLRSLDVHNCQFDSAFLECLRNLAALEELEVGSNKIADTAALKRLFEGIKRKVTSFGLQGNPLTTLEYENLVQWAKASCSCLKSIDGKGVSHDFVNEVKLEQTLQFSADMTSNLQDKASCSCLEGNPCAVAYNCKNWSNRFKVAEDARRELKYQVNN